MLGFARRLRNHRALPNSPQECFDLTIKAFNFSEDFRVPVMFMMDEVVGHMTEKVVIPPADEIEVVPRRHTQKSVDDYLPYASKGDQVPEMAHAGEGYKFHVTGLTHDEHGYPNMTPQTQDKLIRRFAEQDPRCRRPHHAARGRRTRGRRRRSRVVRNHVAGRATRDRTGTAARSARGQTPPDHLLAVPGKTNPAVGTQHESIRGAGTQPGTDGARSRTRRGGGVAKTYSVPHAGGSVHRPEDILKVIVQASR